MTVTVPGDRSWVFEQYPELRTVRGKVPDEIVVREVSKHAEEFEAYRRRASEAIPSALLGELFEPEVEKQRVVLECFLGQWGNVSVEELCKICLITQWLRPQAVFEFGTFNGLTTLQLALNTPASCCVYTLDISPDSTELNDLRIGDVDRHLAEKMGAFSFPIGHYFHGTPHATRIVQLWGNSMNVDVAPFAGAIDLVFIDAGHTYDYVKNDTEKALRMLRPRGVMLWHDYLQVLHPGVTRYLYELRRDGLPIAHLKGTHLVAYFRQA